MKRTLPLGASILLTSSFALAESPVNSGLDPVPPNVHVVDDAEPALPLVPRAPDLLGKHLLVGAAIGPVWSLGKLSRDVAAVRGIDTGVGLHADVGLGLSRSVAAGVWGSFASYGDGDTCDSCAGRSLAVGPYVRYHLSQGFRFDPWLSLGAGYRRLSYEADGAKRTYGGAEWLRLELGADYYLLSGLGFGPYAALGLSSYWSRPGGAEGSAVNTELSGGLRIFLDVPGR